MQSAVIEEILIVQRLKKCQSGADLKLPLSQFLFPLKQITLGGTRRSEK